MEYLDILDEDGKPTGEQKPRAEVHSKGYWHNVVHIYIFRTSESGGGELEFLVQQRAKTKDLHPNKWDTRFGGHVKSGETIEETAVKEMHEEVGLKVKFSDLLKGPLIRWDDNKANREVVTVFFYRFKIGDESSLRFNDGEVQQVKWLTPIEILRLAKANPEEWTSRNQDNLKKILAEIKNKLS